MEEEDVARHTAVEGIEGAVSVRDRPIRLHAGADALGKRPVERRRCGVVLDGAVSEPHITAAVKRWLRESS